MSVSQLRFTTVRVVCSCARARRVENPITGTANPAAKIMGTAIMVTKAATHGYNFGIATAGAAKRWVPCAVFCEEESGLAVFFFD